MTRLRSLALAPAVALVLAGCAVAADKPADTSSALKKPEASIPFIDHRSINDWQADGEDGLWIEDTRRQWYYAKMLAPCIGLDFAIRLGFQTRTSSTFDRFSYVIVPGEPGGGRCALTSLVKSDPPPKRDKKDGKKEVEVVREPVKDAQ